MKSCNFAAVANYTTAVTTTYQNTRKGLSKLPLVLDASGRPTAYDASLLHFNGDGRYVDTGWNDDTTQSYTIETVLYLPKDGSPAQQFGSGAGNYFEVQSNNNFSYYGSVDRRFSASYTAGYVHVIAIYDADSVSNKLYLNNTEVTSVIASGLTPTGNFLIGKLSSYSWSQKQGIFKVHNKSLDATEVATAYAQAKLLYPTLP